MAVDRSAEAFDSFAANLQGAQAPAPAAPEPAPTPTDPTPEPAAAPEPTPSPEQPADGATATPPGDTTPKDEPKAAEAPKPEDQPRDEQGRFIRVGVHARVVKEHQERIKSLETELQTLKGDQSPKTIEALEALKEKFPEELVDAITAQFLALGKQNEQLVQQVQQMAERETARAEAEQAEVQSTLQREIATIPQLQEWYAQAFAEGATPEQQDLWQRAVEADAALRDTPAWSNKPPAERFAKAVARVCEDVGLEFKGTVAAAPTTPKAPEAPKPAAPTAPAAATPKELPTPPPAPASLSSMPTGGSPATPKAVPAEGLSLHQAAAATRNMTRDQMEKFFFGSAR